MKVTKAGKPIVPKMTHAVRAVDYYGEYFEFVRIGAKKKDTGYEYHGHDMRLAKPGNKLYVQWPDKTITQERLVVYRDTGSAQIDMNNHPDTFPTQQLQVKADFHGKKVHITLNDGTRVAFA